MPRDIRTLRPSSPRHELASDLARIPSTFLPPRPDAKRLGASHPRATPASAPKHREARCGGSEIEEGRLLREINARGDVRDAALEKREQYERRDKLRANWSNPWPTNRNTERLTMTAAALVSFKNRLWENCRCFPPRRNNPASTISSRSLLMMCTAVPPTSPASQRCSRATASRHRCTAEPSGPMCARSDS